MGDNNDDPGIGKEADVTAPPKTKKGILKNQSTTVSKHSEDLSFRTDPVTALTYDFQSHT